MCDQTEVSYLDGDVVWVKLGSIWWPGLVKGLDNDDVKSVVQGLKKPPLAVVQFFNEGNLEIINNIDHICHYNNRRKEEFIKKGIDKHRIGHSHMMKFPVDVQKAETLVDGNPNILADPQFAPPKKNDYSDIFGSPIKRKLKKEEDQGRPTVRRHTIGTTTLNRPLPGIIQERLIRPVKRGPLVEPGAIYNCPFCKFESRLINNIATHVKLIHTPNGFVSYARDKTFTPPHARVKSSRKTIKMKKFSTKSPAMEYTPKPTSSATLSSANTPTSIPLTEEPKSTTKSFIQPEKKKPRFTDALLADWSDDDLTDQLNETLNSDDTITKATDSSPKHDEVIPKSLGTPKKEESCFDFDDDDDGGFIGMSDANTYGRKIPRVIPVKDKTDLGMDLDFEELFKRKPEPPKKRGRPPKKTKTVSPISQIDIPKTKRKRKDSTGMTQTLASTRTRRPGSRKSYSNEEIRSIADVPEKSEDEKQDSESEDEDEMIERDEEDEIEEREQHTQEHGAKEINLSMDIERKNPLREESDDDMVKSKPSDMQSRSRRKQNLTELNELPEIPVLTDNKKRYTKSKIKFKKEDEDKEKDDLSERVDDLLAETSVPEIPQEPLQSSHDEDIDNTIEYLEDELAEDPETKKQLISNWEDESLVGSRSETVADHPMATSTNVLKVHTPTLFHQKNGGLILVKPSQSLRTNSQKLMFVASTAPQKVHLVGQGVITTTTIATTTTTTTSIPPNPGLKKVAVPKKLYQQISSGNSPQKLVLSTTTSGSVVRTVIFKDPTTKKTSPKNVVVIKDKPNLQSTRVVYAGDTVPRKIILSPSKATSTATALRTLRAVDPTPIQKVVCLKPQPITTPAVITEATPLQIPSGAGTSQVVAMPGPPGPDGLATYILVTVDEHGNLQPVETTTLNTASATVSDVVVASSHADMVSDTLDVAPGQDILAAALADTLDSSELSLPSQAPSTHETSLTLQKPIMTPMEIPSSASTSVLGVMQDNAQSLVITPPTAIISDTSMSMLDSESSIQEQSQREPCIDELVIDAEQQEALRKGAEVKSMGSLQLQTEESIIEESSQEDVISDQGFEAQKCKFLPTSTDPQFENESKDDKENQDMPFIYDEPLQMPFNGAQETEVTSTTGDGKENN